MYLIQVNNKGYNSVTKKIKLKQEPFIGKDNRFHYVYRVFVPYTEWEYIGSRTSDNWENDTYLGSSSYDTYQDDINESGEVLFEILSFHNNRNSANKEERRLVTKDFLKQERVYNKCRPSKSTTVGCITVKDKDGNTLSIKTDDPRYISGNLIPVSTYMVSVVDKQGNKLQVSKEEFNNTNNILVGVTKGMVSAKDKYGNILQVTKEEFDRRPDLVGVTKGVKPTEEYKKLWSEKNKEYWKDKVHHTKGMTTYKDKDGNTYHCKKDDPRVISGELVSITKGMIAVRDKDGNRFQVFKDDPRVISGELVSTTVGNIGWTAIVIIDGLEKRIKYWADDFGTTINQFPQYCKDNNIPYEWKNPKNNKFSK